MRDRACASPVSPSFKNDILFKEWGYKENLLKEHLFVSLIEEKVIKIVVDQLNVSREECVPEADFIDDLGADSLDIVELVMAMEENFDIEISDDELKRIRTIQDVIDYIVDSTIEREEKGYKPQKIKFRGR